MINGIRLKVCGLTSLVDAEAADASGADYLGFIFYPASPRYVSFANYEAMRERLPLRKKVAVSVEPTLTDLVRQRALGFDHFQIHCPAQTPPAVLQAWADTVGAARLWLAPRSPAAMPIPLSCSPSPEPFCSILTTRIKWAERARPVIGPNLKPIVRHIRPNTGSFRAGWDRPIF